METQTVRIDMDTRRAEQDLGRFEARADALIASLESIVVNVLPEIDDDELNDLLGQLEGFDPVVEVALDVDQTPLDELDTAVAGLDTNLVFDVEADAAQLDEVAAKALELDERAIDVPISTPGTEQAIADFDSLGVSTDDLTGKLTSGLPAGIQKTITSLGGLGLAIGVAVAAFTALINIGLQVEAAQNDIQIATGATGGALDDLTDSALRVIDEVPQALDVAANAVGTLNTFLGVTGSELEGIAVGVLDASRLLGEDAASNTKNFAQVLNLFGIEADKGVEKLDLLFAATQKYGVGLGELLGTLESSGGIFQAVGLDLEESVTLIGQFNLAGLGANEATAALTQLIARADDTGKSFNQTLLDLQASIKDAATEQEAFAIGIDNFGTRSGVAFSQAIRAGIIDLEQLSGALGDTGGLVQSTAADTETASQSLRLALNDLTEALGPIALELTEALTKLVQVITTVFDILTESKAIDFFLDGLRLISTTLDILSGDFLSFGDLILDIFDIILGPINELIGILPGIGDPIEGVRGQWEKLRGSLEDPIEPKVNTDGVVERFSAMERGAGAALRATRAAAEEAALVAEAGAQFGDLAAALGETDLSADALVATLSGPLRSAVTDILANPVFTDGAEARIRLLVDEDALAAAGGDIETFLGAIEELTNERTVTLAESFSTALGAELDRIQSQLDLQFNIDTSNGINDVQDAINQIDSVLTEYNDRQKAAESPLLDGLEEVQRRVASGEFDALIDDINEGEGGTNRALLERLEASLDAVAQKQAEEAQAAAKAYSENFIRALEEGEQVDPVQALIDSSRITADQFVDLAKQVQASLDQAVRDETVAADRQALGLDIGTEQAEATIDGWVDGLVAGGPDVNQALETVSQSPTALRAMTDAGAAFAEANIAAQLAVIERDALSLPEAQLAIITSEPATSGSVRAGEDLANAYTDGWLAQIGRNAPLFQRAIEDALPGAASAATPFAAGGTIRRPTFAMMGEAGVETVVPEYASITHIKRLLGETSILRRLEEEFSAQQRRAFEHFNGQASAMGLGASAPASSTTTVAGSYVDRSRTEIKIVDGGQSLASKQLTARQAIAELRRDRERRRRKFYAGAAGWGA